MQETQETLVQSLGRENPLKKEMATHSSILAWEIPWTEEPGSSWGHKRIRHNLVTKQEHMSQVAVVFTTANAGDMGSAPGSGRSSGEGNGNPLQYSSGESHGERRLVAYSPWSCQESDLT